MTFSPATAETAPVRAAAQRRLTIGLCTTIVATAFETIAVATAMPVAAQDLDGLAYYAWSFSLFGIGMLFSTVVAGRLSDRIGPARPLLAGLAVFLIGLVVAGSAGHMVQLVAGRLIQGLGSGLSNTAIFVLVASAYSATARPRMFTYISTAWVLPSFVGPPIAAGLTARLSWHWVFFAVIPLVIVGGAMAWPSLRRLMATHEPAAPDPDGAQPAPLWAAGMVAISAAALQLAGQRLDWVALGLAVLGLAGLVVGLPRLMPACFGRFQRGLSSVIITRGLLAGAFVGAEAFVPLMLVEERDVALVLAGAALTVGSVGWTTGSWLQSRPWLTIRRDRLITLGCLSLTLGVLATGLVALWPQLPYGLVGLAWVFSGLGMGLASASTGLAVMTLSVPAEQGRNGSSLNLSDALGAGLFVGASGSIFAALRLSQPQPVTFGVVLGAMAFVALLATVASLRIGVVRNEFVVARAAV